ncbi:transcriptional regulator [Mycolicibacterium conceptionense]|uniref:Transcriptional regulator n=1 Tax=Mycolicibacterium conceptionense TaxID=451644 RepID=A0A0U1DG30_9MYCO|nr:helix-turn-helix transcriptional regulator [Mycolicibacterium conceptionense]ORV20037.1 hypothetical protein AWB98_29270 [Mycolicibacterium conceptionense]CQD15794.1 transcriptional regulator [Mycolicibacterium conceptionense]
MTDLVAQLVAIRKAKGIKQGTIARRMYVSAPMISAFETGRREPLASTLFRYAEAVGARIVVEDAAVPPHGHTERRTGENRPQASIRDESDETR